MGGWLGLRYELHTASLMGSLAPSITTPFVVVNNSACVYHWFVRALYCAVRGGSWGFLGEVIWRLDGSSDAGYGFYKD